MLINKYVLVVTIATCLNTYKVFISASSLTLLDKTSPC